MATAGRAITKFPETDVDGEPVVGDVGLSVVETVSVVDVWDEVDIWEDVDVWEDVELVVLVVLVVMVSSSDSMYSLGWTSSKLGSAPVQIGHSSGTASLL